MNATSITRAPIAGAPRGRPALLAALPLLAALAVAGTAQAAPRDPSGVWLTEDGKARIRVERCGAQNANMCGFVVWLKTPLNDEGQPRVDFRNPDGKKRTRPSLGHQVILGLKANADSKYEGKIYNSEDGKTYDVTLWSEETEALSVRGCMLGFLCGSQTWKRMVDVAPGQMTGPVNGANGPRADVEWAPKISPAAAATTGTTAPKATAPKPGASRPVAVEE